MTTRTGDLLKNQRRKKQGGFALILVTVMAAVIAITLYMEMPRLMFESQRAKEETLVQRANQYVRAVQLFQRKLKRSPQTIDDLENTNQLRFLRRRYVDPFTGKDDWRIIKSDELAKRKQKQGQNGQPGAPGTDPNGTGLATTTPVPIPTPEQLSTLTGVAIAGGPRRASDQPGFPRPGGDPNQNPNPTDPNAPQPNPYGQPPQPPQYGQPGPVVQGQPGFPGSNIPAGFLPPGVVQPGQRPAQFPGYPTGAANSQFTPQPFQPTPNQPQTGSPPLSTPDNPALAMIGRILTTPNPNGAQIAQAAAASGTTQMGVGIVGIASKYDAEGIKRINEKSNIKEWEFIYDQTQDKSLQKPGGPNQIGTPIGQSGNNSNGASNNNAGSNSTGFGGNTNNNGGFGSNSSGFGGTPTPTRPPPR